MSGPTRKDRVAEAAEFARIHKLAHEAGHAAAMAHVPRPMVIRGYDPIADGVCGFAWIVVKPANSPFANWLKKHGLGSRGYGGGVHIWVSDYNQSMEKKEAYARSYASTLAANGIPASWSSRMD